MARSWPRPSSEPRTRAATRAHDDGDASCVDGGPSGSPTRVGGGRASHRRRPRLLPCRRRRPETRVAACHGRDGPDGGARPRRTGAWSRETGATPALAGHPRADLGMGVRRGASCRRHPAHGRPPRRRRGPLRHSAARPRSAHPLIGGVVRPGDTHRRSKAISRPPAPARRGHTGRAHPKPSRSCSRRDGEPRPCDLASPRPAGSGRRVRRLRPAQQLPAPPRSQGSSCD